MSGKWTKEPGALKIERQNNDGITLLNCIYPTRVAQGGGETVVHLGSEDVSWEAVLTLGRNQSEEDPALEREFKDDDRS